MTLPSGFFTMLGALIAGGLILWAIRSKKAAVDLSEKGGEEERPGTVIKGGENGV